MPIVYLKSGITVQVKQDDLEDYLYKNAKAIQIFHKLTKRKPVGTELEFRIPH